MKLCFAVKERHPILPDRIVHYAGSCEQATIVCEVKNGKAIKLTDEPKYYVGITPMKY